MRKLITLSLLGVLLLFAGPAKGQTHAITTGNVKMQVTLTQTAGGTNIITTGWCPSNCVSGSTVGSPVTVTDSLGDTYTSAYRKDGAGSGQIFYASTMAGVSTITVSIPASNSSVVMASTYPGAWVPDTSANMGDLIYAEFVGSGYPGVAAGAGFTELNTGAWWSDEFSTTSLTPTFVVNGVVTPPNLTFSFKPATPPPPPLPTLTLNLNSGSTAVYDDTSAILPGPITVSQLQNPTSTVGIGTITSDNAGNLSGSLTINPNWVDANGNLTFLFGLPAVPNVISYPVPVGEFQHGSTGLTINLVLFKQGPLAIKSQTLAVTP